MSSTATSASRLTAYWRCWWKRGLPFGTIGPLPRSVLTPAIHSGAGAGLMVETIILSGQPDEVLGKRVEEHGSCLVAMGAYGHSRIRAFVLGSTTSEMLRSCKAPVVLMR